MALRLHYQPVIMHRLLYLAPLALVTGCLAQEPPLADVQVTWNLAGSYQMPSSEIETLVNITSTVDGASIDGEYRPGYTGNVVLTMDPRPEPVRVCVQLYVWAEKDSPPPWCDLPCLEQVELGPVRCQDVIVESDVHVTF